MLVSYLNDGDIEVHALSVDFILNSPHLVVLEGPFATVDDEDEPGEEETAHHHGDADLLKSIEEHFHLLSFIYILIINLKSLFDSLVLL